MNMATSTISNEIPSEMRAELTQTLADLAKGVRDPQKMKAAAWRMDQMRERNRQVFGSQDIGVEIIREMRASR
jgi:hypothetical protein